MREVLVDDWRKHARCRGLDPQTADSIYFGGHRDDDARHLCRQCRVSAECLADALAVETPRGSVRPFGVRAGLTAQERVVLLRRQRDLTRT